MGAGYGVGTTHTAVSMAYYLADILKMKTALVEIGSRPALDALSIEADEVFDDLSAFIRDEIHVFPKCSRDRLTRILGGDYEYIVLDITDTESACLQEFVRADISFLVCSLCEWRVKDTENIVGRIISNYKDISLLNIVTTTIKEQKKRTTSKESVINNTNIFVIPFIAEPLRLEKQHLKFFKELLIGT